jgi:hypothetical protein
MVRMNTASLKSHSDLEAVETFFWAFAGAELRLSATEGSGVGFLLFDLSPRWRTACWGVDMMGTNARVCLYGLQG